MNTHSMASCKKPMNPTYNMPNCKKPINPNCCRPTPHYSTITDNNFLSRNIELSNINSRTSDSLTHINSQRGQCEDDYKARRGFPVEHRILRQDLNTGRHYIRGLSDNLDSTISERNNFSIGWFNGKHGGDIPGSDYYRNPYCENYVPYSPECVRPPMADMRTFGTRWYRFGTVYDLERYPQSYCRSSIPCRPGQKQCNLKYNEEYI